MSDTEKNNGNVTTLAGRAQPRLAAAVRDVPALTIVAHPQLQRVGDRLLLESLVTANKPAALSRNAPDFTRPGGLMGLPLGDPFISRTPVRLEPGPRGGVRLLVPEDATSVSVAGAPVTGGREFTSEEVNAGVPLVLAERVVLLLHRASTAQRASADDLGIVGHGEGIQLVRDNIARVADLTVPVLIRGETGTGKELVARAIHDRGPRRSGPFVSVNLGALSKELVSAELFGAERGAYTGSTKDREGFFRAAQGGTLFLDEVGEAPPEVQVALLRVLETGEIYPVGGHAPVKVDVRLVSATDANLEARIEERLFRAPLLHRLAGFEIHMPRLRERREDLGPLFMHFARQELDGLEGVEWLSSADPRAKPWLPASLAVRLVRYSWPGNVRQLRNIVRQLIIGSRGLPHLRVDPRLEQTLDADALPVPGSALSVEAVPAPDAEPEAKPQRRKPSEVSEQELLEALRACSWDLKATADWLGIPRPSVYVLIDRSSLLRTARDLSPEEITRCYHECAGDLDKMVQRLEVSKRALQRRVRELGLER
ncbi:sigma-54-dependent Fis family transcriptional regulator [Pyxidicoccus fallax]|uniref:Sigma-54-dependent Fis family transcriptional regulator n=1 Tax=Pyxidicoccus fallax TaxID=394095 RepID=A0A848LLW1_9BACT|nr:sigma-54 dependent transcriptional regulator [Pyxidicoccus fallax]NMO18660.1 sigma-54-dependent Fis family transcriptional regulator [Pyxidicoccus fallax]NPC80990.1 sigma-54-dependent Fis family transcriptional regulator [Pyxidicoccus fallax]